MRRQRRSASQGASGAWTSDAVAARLESKLVGLNLVELQHRGVKLLSALADPLALLSSSSDHKEIVRGRPCGPGEEETRTRGGGEGGAAVATGERTPRGGTGGSAGPDADLARKGTRQPDEVRAGGRQSKKTGGGNSRGRDGSGGRGGGREGGPGGA